MESYKIAINAMTTVPADYPTQLAEDILLPDHQTLHIRALHRDEERPIRELYEHLSPATRYRRFFSPMPALPDSVMRLLVTVDYRRKLALVAETDGDRGREVVGLGSFGAVDDRVAEVALVVRDEWQRRRIGTALAQRVLRAAEDRGFRRFLVHILSENTPARKILGKIGEVVLAKASGGISELVFVRRQITPSAPADPCLH
jgi:RimJ/RimL family protein N-acetyltransferase